MQALLPEIIKAGLKNYNGKPKRIMPYCVSESESGTSENDFDTLMEEL